jgi:beta-1,4-mannosyltransferase
MMSMASTEMSRAAGVDVLAWPARRNAEENSFNARLSDATEDRCFRVHEFSPSVAVRGRYDVLHLHWPDALLKNVSGRRQGLRLVALSVLLLWVRRVRHVPIVWTVHNIAPHNGARGWATKWLRLLLTHCVDHQVHLNRLTSSELRRTSPGLARHSYSVIPHGTYDDELHSRDSTALRAAMKLTQDEIVISFLGTISPYKGAHHLARVFSSWTDEKVRLVVAGACAVDTLREELLLRAAADPRIHLDLTWLTTPQLASYLDLSNVVVFPYTRVLNSGSVMLALSAGRPVIAPRLGSLSEIEEAVGPEWVRLYDGELDRDTLSRCVSVPPPAGSPDLSPFSWPAIGQAHRDCYLNLLKRGSK